MELLLQFVARALSGVQGQLLPTAQKLGSSTLQMLLSNEK